MLHCIQALIESTRGQDILYLMGAYLALFPYVVIGGSAFAAMIYAIFKCIQAYLRHSWEKDQREERKRRGPPKRDPGSEDGDT